MATHSFRDLGRREILGMSAALAGSRVVFSVVGAAGAAVAAGTGTGRQERCQQIIRAKSSMKPPG
jgi:hypothetical protein